MLMRHRLDFVTPDRKVRLETSALIDAGDEMVGGGRRTSAAAAAVVRELDASTEAAEAEVAAWADRIKEAVDQRAAALVEEIAAVRNLKTQRLEEQIAAVDAMMDTFGKAIAKTREGMAMVDDGGKDAKMNAGVKKLEQAIKKYTEQPVPLEPCETATLGLATPAEQLVDLLAHEGAVAGLRARALTAEPTEIPGGGCEIEITGTDFGVDTSLLEVWIGPVRCKLLELHDEGGGRSLARCVAPPGSGTDLPVDVRLCGEHGWSADGTAVSYAAPRIESLDPPGGPIGTELTIHGHHLGGPGAPPLVSIGGISCPQVDVVDAHSALRITVPDDLPTGTFSVVVQRGSQASTEKGEEPDPVSLFDVAVKLRFGFDPKANGGGLDFDLPDESKEGQGLVYTVRKVENLNPDYTTVPATHLSVYLPVCVAGMLPACLPSQQEAPVVSSTSFDSSVSALSAPRSVQVLGTESFKRGIHAWEVNFDRIGNTRVGLARWPGLSLDCGLHSKDLQGETWFVDYDGMVKHNRRGVVSER